MPTYTGTPLRPGRTQTPIQAKKPSPRSLATSGARGGYRATGGISVPEEVSAPQAAPSGTRALETFSARVPEQPSALGQAAMGVGSKLVGSALEKPISNAFNYGKNAFDARFNANYNDVAGPIAGAIPKAGGGFTYPSGAETFPYVDYGSAVGVPLAEAAGSAGDWAGDAGDWAGSLYGADEFADVAMEGYSDLAGEAGGGIPYLGAGIHALQGDWGSAVGSGIGYAVGGPVGGAIGGFVGGALDDCFITEAVMAAGGKGDDAEPLQVLRWFRDNVLASTPEGQQMIQQYEQIAPMVVEAVNQREDNMAIYASIYQKFIAPAVEAVKAGQYPQALQIYSAMVAEVTQYAQATEGAMQEDMAMEGMEENAQNVAQDPQRAMMAAPTGGGALNQFNARSAYPTPLRFGRR